MTKKKGMRPRPICVSVVALVLLNTLALAQDDLPIEIQADLIQREILDSLRNGNFEGVLSAVDRLDTLHVPFPPTLRWVEARAAYQQDQYARAYTSLKSFLKAADRESSEYKSALALFADYKKQGENSLTDSDRRIIGKWKVEPRTLDWELDTEFQRGSLTVEGKIGQGTFRITAELISEHTIKTGGTFADGECAGLTECTTRSSEKGTLRLSGEKVTIHYTNPNWTNDELVLAGDTMSGNDGFGPLILTKN